MSDGTYCNSTFIVWYILLILPSTLSELDLVSIIVTLQPLIHECFTCGVRILGYFAKVTPV